MTDNLQIKDWYNSTYHRHLHAAYEYKEASQFIDRLIGVLKPAPGSIILEVGCGDGLRCKKLAESGFSVTGVDAATENIAKAQQWASDTLSFYEHDVRLPFWGNYFHFAFNFFNQFGYYRTKREHNAAIRSIASALKPGGVFVIDYTNRHYAEVNQVPQEIKNIGSHIYSLTRRNDETHFYTEVNISDSTGSTPIGYTEQYAKFSLGDFTEMLSQHGMQVDEVFGDYQLNAFDLQQSPRLIIVARKKEIEATDKEKRLYSDGRKTDALT